MLSWDVTGQESQEKVSKKESCSGKVKENGFKVSKNFYFDMNIFKTVLWL